MKKVRSAFTLVEMMIVIAILAVLMTMTFRLVKTGDEDKKRSDTIVKLHKIENCLSGYYAAFGSYPAVALHGTRDIYCKVEDGDQTDERNEGALASIEAQVQAACRAQPFGCEYPPGEEELDAIEKWGKTMSQHVSDGYVNYQSSTWSYTWAFNGSITGPTTGSGFNNAFPHGSSPGLSDWSNVKLFRFGVMSFLLPRYLFMMRSNEGWFGDGGGKVCAQWSDNNDVPSDPFEGKSYGDVQEDGESGWPVVKNRAGGNQKNEDTDSAQARRDRAGVENIPSQAVCARWMPNLEGSCYTSISETFFGINISSGSWMVECNGFTTDQGDPTAIIPPSPLPIHRPPSGGAGYCNGWITMLDGWNQEFFYYSPAPYQSYTVWSSGANKKTFPPWVSLEGLSAADRETAMEWKGDDVMGMSEGK